MSLAVLPLQMNLRSFFVAALGLLIISASAHVLGIEAQPAPGMSAAFSTGGADVFDAVLPQTERDQRARSHIGPADDGDGPAPKVRLFHIGLPFPLPAALYLPQPPPLTILSLCAGTCASAPRAPPVLS